LLVAEEGFPLLAVLPPSRRPQGDEIALRQPELDRDDVLCHYFLRHNLIRPFGPVIHPPRARHAAYGFRAVSAITPHRPKVATARPPACDSEPGGAVARLRPRRRQQRPLGHED